jgi:hypothetical protein
MNSGLSGSLKEAFPNVSPVSRPLVKAQKIPNPQWLAGFVSAEGWFPLLAFQQLSLYWLRIMKNNPKYEK